MQLSWLLRACRCSCELRLNGWCSSSPVMCPHSGSSSTIVPAPFRPFRCPLPPSPISPSRLRQTWDKPCIGCSRCIEWSWVPEYPAQGCPHTRAGRVEQRCGTPAQRPTPLGVCVRIFHSRWYAMRDLYLITSHAVCVLPISTLTHRIRYLSTLPFFPHTPSPPPPHTHTPSFVSPGHAVSPALEHLQPGPELAAFLKDMSSAFVCIYFTDPSIGDR